MTTWLDNLIPLKSRLNHLQLAGWKPSKVAAQNLGCRLLADVMIPMKDGTKLSADVYLPREPGRYPAIVQFSAYNRDLHSIGVPKGTNEIGSPPVITGRGYAQVVVTARGVGRSEGELRRWHAESEVQDHLACVAWASEQPWSTGDVCLFGTSYYGMNQPTIAAHRPPALKAFFCNEICTDFRRHVFRYAGYPNIEFFGLWTGANFTAKGVKLYVPPVARALLSHVVNRPFLWNLVRPRIDSIMQGFKKNRPIPRALENLVAFFTDTDTDPNNRTDEGSFRRLSQIEVPFVVVQNRGNISLHQFGAYDLFENAATPPDRKWLIIGPAEYELPAYSWQLEALAFFDHVVKGIDNGYDRQPAVRWWRDGAGDGEAPWGTAVDFPPPASRKLALHPAANGTLETGPVAEAESHWLAVPQVPGLVPGTDSVMPHVLRFAWKVPTGMELVGPTRLRLGLASTEIDTHVTVRLDRIDRDGKRHCLSMGNQRAATRQVMPEYSTRAEQAIDDRIKTPLVPGEPVDLIVNMTPTAAVLHAGDTLELAVASRPALLAVSVADGFLSYEGYGLPQYIARNTLLHGTRTALEVTLLPSPE
ncbi:MAG: acyl esterase [Rhodospirillaceae bacterium]|nr:MAG: acyl esterase [Rhodospirillaceae bacterium]